MKNLKEIDSLKNILTNAESSRSGDAKKYEEEKVQFEQTLKNAHENELARFQEKIKEVEISKESLCREFDSKEATLRKEIQDLNQQIESIKLVGNDLENNLKEVHSNLDESHKNELNSLHRQIEELTLSSENLRQEFNLLKDKEISFKKEIEQLHLENLNSNENIKKLVSQRDELEKSKENSTKQLEMRNNEFDNIVLEKDHLNKQLVELQSLNAQIQ